MSIVSNWVLDNGLLGLRNTADCILITTVETVDYNAANGAMLGLFVFGVGSAVNFPSNHTPDGRKVRTNPITNGQVTNSGMGTHFVIIDTVNQRALASGPVSTQQQLEIGNEFKLGAIELRMPASISMPSIGA